LVSGSAEGVQHQDTIGGDVCRLRQRLNQHLMMAGLAGGWSIAVCEHGNQRSLHDRPIGCIEARTRAERRDPGIRQRTLRCGQQPCDPGLIGDVSFELSDAKEAV
jgi:hypothetical protein